MSSAVMEWDELNLLRESVPGLLAEYKQTKNRERVDHWCDYMEFVLCLIYAYGWQDAEEIVGIVPFKDGLDDKTVNLEIEGETFRERVQKQLDEGSMEGILRIIETESIRDYNAAVYEAGKESGVPGVRKQWVTMMDGRVRETHDYLEGETVGIDDLFYTFDGDSAYAPGGFEKPENNINCRCHITLAL